MPVPAASLSALRLALTDGAAVADEEWRRFAADVRDVRVGVGGLLFAQGAPVDCVWFLSRGLVRYFACAVGDAREVTFGFDYEGRLCSDFDGYFARRPASRSAVAIEDVHALAISRAAFDAALQRDPVWERVLRRALERLVLQLADKERRIRTLSAEQRYRLLLEQRSPLATRLPQYHLAAYLGVTPETLSRIRARL